jgi:hypothetical protein
MEKKLNLRILMPKYPRHDWDCNCVTCTDTLRKARETLKLAISEIRIHNTEYHHITPEDTLKKWEEFTKLTLGSLDYEEGEDKR